MSIMSFDIIYDIVEHINRCKSKGYFYFIEHVHMLHYDMKPFIWVHDIKKQCERELAWQCTTYNMNQAQMAICIIINMCHIDLEPDIGM